MTSSTTYHRGYAGNSKKIQHMNNKFIDKKLKEFDARYPNWDIIPRDDVEQFIKEALVLQREEILERVIARMKNEKDIHIEYNTSFDESIEQVVYELYEMLKSEQVDYDKLSEEWEKAEPEIQKKLQDCNCHCIDVLKNGCLKCQERNCTHCQKPEEKEV